MKILVLNQDWFVQEWRDLGHEVLSAGLSNQLDVILSTPLLHIDTIIKACPNNFSPELIIYYDNSMPLLWTGLDETDIPTLFYSVDAHHHVDQHKYLSCVFDHTIVAQKDYISSFHAVQGSASWMPLWASRSYEASTEKKYKVVFIGTLDPALNPNRVALIEHLKQRIPIEVLKGEYWRYFPHAEIVLNQTVKGDLNFRVFEAMMSGSLLVTERTDNGLLELFKEGEHLVLYERNNAESAVEVINYYLDRPKLAQEIGRNGRLEILSKHTPAIRGQQVLEQARQIKKRKSTNRFYAAMTNLVTTAHSMTHLDNLLTVKAYAEALKSGAYGLSYNESINDLFAAHAVVASLRYDQLVVGDAGRQFLATLATAYQGQPTLSYAMIRTLLNSGNISEARALAESISPEEVEYTFQIAEQTVCELLSL